MMKSLCTAAAMALMMAAPVAAQTSHNHAHDHDHAHDHAQDAAKAQIYKGYFDDAQIAPRPLPDWEGEWQSVYPLLVAGTLDPVMAHKAEAGDKTAAEYRAYYETGYRSDVDRITIAGDHITFHRATGDVAGDYAADGHEVLTYKKGNRGVRFIFKKVAGDAAAPGFIQFSDHKIAPEKADHYHLYMGDDRAKLLEQLENWPTYYPAALTPAQVDDEMLAH